MTQSSVTTEYAMTAHKKSKWRKVFQTYKYHYLLLLPGLLYFIIYKYLPMAGIVIAFEDFKMTKGMFASPWVGMKWFNMLFESPDFWRAFNNTLIISFYKLVFNFPAPVILSLMINEVMNSKVKKVIQTIIYFPHFLSWVVLGGIMFALFAPQAGLLSIFGLEQSPLMGADTFRSSLVLSQMWKETGWGTIIYLAAMAGINPELYEAARMDGANRFHLARYITLPALVGTMIILFILRTGQILHAGFDQVFILYNPLVYNVGDILDTYVYRVGLTSGRFSLATAAGLFQSVVGLFLILFTNWLAKRMGGKGLW
jgi:putative aldouronate transport system permease protein